VTVVSSYLEMGQGTHTGWSCPCKTGHQLPVKLMPLPSA
jgi:hypothetical protein